MGARGFLAGSLRSSIWSFGWGPWGRLVGSYGSKKLTCMADGTEHLHLMTKSCIQNETWRFFIFGKMVGSERIWERIWVFFSKYIAPADSYCNGCIGQYGVITGEQLLGYPSKVPKISLWDPFFIALFFFVASFFVGDAACLVCLGRCEVCTRQVFGLSQWAPQCCMILENPLWQKGWSRTRGLPTMEMAKQQRTINGSIWRWLESFENQGFFWKH